MSDFPRHLSFIMDGNGRWATARGLDRPAGHRAGFEAMLRVVDAALAFDIPEVSFFALSMDNLARRSSAERQGIYDLVLRFAREYAQLFAKQGIRVRFFGALDTLPTDLGDAIADMHSLTDSCDRLKVGIALAYSGRTDVYNAAKGASDCADVELHLQSYSLSAVDMLVRTGGEQRLSDYMLWQIAYAELMFSDILWPDADREFVRAILCEYAKRHRRFGGYGT